MRLLVVRCGAFRFALPTGLVRGVVSAEEIVPLDLPDLEGLMWRDGELIPATRLHPLLHSSRSKESGDGHGVLVHAEGRLLCVMVDEAMDLVEVPAESIVPLPELVKRALKVDGLESATLTDELLLILDPVRLLGTERVATLVRAAAVAVNSDSVSEGRG